jgi:hypothetical protein
LAVVEKFKDLPKFDFFPFKISITHTFTTLKYFTLLLLLLYFNSLIPLGIYSSHPLQNPICFPKGKKRPSLVLWKIYETKF